MYDSMNVQLIGMILKTNFLFFIQFTRNHNVVNILKVIIFQKCFELCHKFIKFSIIVVFFKFILYVRFSHTYLVRIILF